MRILSFVALSCLAFALAGCGGSGIVSPFFGSYAAEPWTQPSPSDTGTITLNVSAVGTVSGSLVDNGASLTYSISGLIDDNGNFSATITPTAGPTGSLSGVLSLSGGGQIVGTLDATGGTLNTLIVN